MMITTIEASDPLETWMMLCQAIGSTATRERTKWVLPSVVLAVLQPRTLEPSEVSWHAALVGDEPWQRTDTLYNPNGTLPWKPGYYDRLLGDERSQWDAVCDLLRKAPGTTSACLALLRPQDSLRAHAVPASVPCPLTVDLKLEEDRLRMTVLFRSQDVLRFGLPDMHHLARIQSEICVAIAANSSRRAAKCVSACPGPLVLHLSEAYVRTRDASALGRVTEGCGPSGPGMQTATDDATLQGPGPLSIQATGAIEED